MSGCLAALARAVRHWRVRRDGDPLVTPRSCVAFGRVADETGDARDVVVKVACTGSDEDLAWAALHHFGGRGCVRLLDHADDAILLERASPGRPLVDLVRAGRDDEATATLCDVATALHAREPPAGAPAFPSAADWGGGFDRYRRTRHAALPAALVDRAEGYFREMVTSQATSRLLHGDLHHENVLLDARRGWLAIDPKGVLAEPAYEFGALLRNPWGNGVDPALCASPTVADRRSWIVAERSGLDRRRVLAWGFAQAVLSAIWSHEDGHAPDHALAVAAGLWVPLAAR